MIDVHCHLLYGVDDGPQSLEESVRMLQQAKKQGITAIILTPHYRHGMFPFPKERIEANFARLRPLAARLGMQLALGTEYHVNSQIGEALASGRCMTLAGSVYVLCEYSCASGFDYIYQMTEELIRQGYIPVIAHAERYVCLTRGVCRVDELRRLGAWIQLNSDAVLGMEGFRARRFCRKLIAAGLADVVASDSHGADRRACHLGQCREFLVKKYGIDTAERLLRRNPSTIFGTTGTSGEVHGEPD